MSRRTLMRGLGISAATVAGLPALASCGFDFGGMGIPPAGDSEANDITGAFDWKRHSGQRINLLLNAHPYQEALIARLAEFTELTGIEVSYDVFPESNYFDKLTLELHSQQGNYDAFMLGGYMVWQYGPPGYLEDLQPWIDNSAATNADFDPDDFYPNLMDVGRWDFTIGSPLGSGNRQWVLPWGWEANVVCYNADVFDQLGLRPAQTMEELAEIAGVITERAPDAGYDGMYGIAVRGSRNWGTIHPGFMTMYSRFGLTDFETDGELLIPRMNSPEAVDFTAVWMDMVRNSGPESWPTYTWYEASGDLGSQQAGMMFDADNTAYFQAVPGASQASGSLAFHPGPKGPDGSLATNLWQWSLGMNAAGSRKPATWWLMQWATGADHLRAAAQDHEHINSVRASIAESGPYRDRLDSLPGFVETFDAVVDQTAIQFTPQGQFMDAATTWAEALQDIYGGADVQQRLDALAASLEARVNA